MPIAAAQRESDSRLFNANIAALTAIQPCTADHLISATAPFCIEPAISRDDTPTYCWRDEANRQLWFGRTTMPRVRGEALIETFQPGSGNVLLHGIGHGIESRILLNRLGAHQAIAIVEPDPWRARVAFSLTDFAPYLMRRQMLLFIGPSAWKDAADFFAENAGFLLPTRILSWPWLEKEDVAFVTGQLRSLQSAVSERRTTTLPKASAAPIKPRDNAIAIFSNHLDPRSLRLCRRIEAGVRAIGFDCICFAPDSPAMLLTAAVQNALAEFAPGAMLFVNAVPGDLNALPAGCRLAIIASRTGYLEGQTMTELSAEVRALALSADARDALLNRGLARDRIDLAADAALPNLPVNRESCGILLLADRFDASPESVGLHLTSHVRLWNEAKKLILDQIDDYRDSQAETVLAAAERKLGYNIDSAEVRAGLTDRIRAVLGPSLIRRAYIEALRKDKIEFTIAGRGWSSSEDIPETPILEPWTAGTAASALCPFGAVVSLNSGEGSADEFLDALASGMIGFVRICRGDSISAKLGATITPDRDIHPFTSRQDFIQSLRRFSTHPDEFRTRFAQTATNIRAHHTWAVRVREILVKIGHPLPAESAP